ncbi:hypothetical protein OG728_38340 (plasmid) [Streptomyces microflavus]|uniref:hypothetical protein n=1 Tax=Streptomyces microflavus TaxID=1919 RepID=UPI002E16119B|nr:hypothetical protein OG728_38340 [Streptomyces microflavus]
MPHFEFALNEVLDVATHTMVAPHNTLRATYDQCQNEDDVHAALWWVRDRSGTYLTGNSTHPGAPRDAFAHGYGPDGDDASAILGADDRVIDAIPLHDPKTEQCLHSDLIRAHRNGHNTLTITMKHNATEVRTHRADVPIAPLGLTTYTQGIIDLAVSKKLHLSWQTGKTRHLLHLTGDNNSGVKVHMTIGARSGKVLRATLTTPADDGNGTTQKTAIGTNNVRALLTPL